MKDIKFRAFINYKSGVSKMEYDGYYLDQNGFLTYTEHHGDDHDCGGSSDSLAYLNDHKYIVMLYIGLKDINGKEIYEGDIVKYPRLDEYYFTGINYVKYIDGGFYPFADNNDGMPYPDPLKCEVIGNIYENKDIICGDSL